LENEPKTKAPAIPKDVGKIVQSFLGGKKKEKNTKKIKKKCS